MVLKADIPHILAVDDDDRIRRLLAQYLTKNGYLVVTAADADEARAVLKQYTFDLCILDVMMPGESGLDLARFIDVSYDLPVLFLTAMTETNDRIAGLEAGADDYLPKPFEPKELLLRVKAILKRSNTIITTPNQAKESKIVDMGGLSFDMVARELRDVSDKIVSLTDGENALLNALCQKPNIPIRREMLAVQLGLEGNDRAIDVQITRLRKKAEVDPANPKYILTVRGKGYMVRPQS
jgi:two-component system phosphate regulon response regulator OmpR